MHWYYQITCNTSVKYIKTSNTQCEVWLKSDFGNRYDQFNKPYPTWDETNCRQITEQEYIQAIGTIDLSFKQKQIMNHRYRFYPDKLSRSNN